MSDTGSMLETISSIGTPNTRIYLRDVRANSSLPRDRQNKALLDLQSEGQIVLMQLDNTPEITNRDRMAELNIAGHPRHILYWTPRPKKAPEKKDCGGSCMAAKKKARKAPKKRKAKKTRTRRPAKKASVGFTSLKQVENALALKKVRSLSALRKKVCQ